MHTRELIARLARLTASREIDQLPVTVLAELLECASEALIEIWMRMPAELRSVLMTMALRSPTSLDVAPVTGRRYVGFSLPEWEGCAIQLPDDPVANRLVSENALERSHAGIPANDGVVGAGLVWHDAIGLPDGTTIVGQDVFLTVNGHHTRLTPWPHTYPLWGQTDVSPGQPSYFAIRVAGVMPGQYFDPESARDGTPQLVPPSHGWWLHLLPRPSVAAILRFNLSVQTERLMIAHFRDNRPLLLSDRFYPHLMRIADQKVAATRLFVGDERLARAIDEEAERSRIALRSIIDSHVTATAPSMGTPIGY